MSFYVKVIQGRDEDWYPTIVGGNNEPVFTGEGHHNRVDAIAISRAVLPDARIVVYKGAESEGMAYALGPGESAVVIEGPAEK